MAAADFEPFGLTGNQGQADAEIFLVTQQTIRVVHAEGDSDQGRDRGQRDITLGKI